MNLGILILLQSITLIAFALHYFEREKKLKYLSSAKDKLVSDLNKVNADHQTLSELRDNLFLEINKANFSYQQLSEAKDKLVLDLNKVNLDYHNLVLQTKTLADKQFEEFKNRELHSTKIQLKELSDREARVQLETWKINYETVIRQDAINRSQSVIAGKVAEHVLPFHSTFPFNSKDARFIGSPIDMIVFDGCDNDDEVDVYFLEIKTGNSQLNRRQKSVKEAIINGRVHWRELRV